VRALQRLSADASPLCTLQQFESRRAVFPEGQLIAECDGEIVGAAASLIVHWNDAGGDTTWSSITGDGGFSTHDPQGRTLIGAHTWIDLARGGFGAARALQQARRKLCRRLNLRRILLIAPLSAYRDNGASSPELYAERVIRGDLDDPGLRLNVAQGYQYCGVLREYFAASGDACRHAALFVWLNPLYAPPRPPAYETQRKCA
jgi:hypothetical protein